ncbi:hypothetical protein DXU92_09210 [Brachybacterium saurashtrense]|uniref:Uncharacterized protein n=1 Tax=Brachybacterium saurashtrense TaxID=556288 RepID=A0AA93DSQ2_9MICO|nr:hypothetical protein DXU92_09210 [Brachybacterium saurashtrense]
MGERRQAGTARVRAEGGFGGARPREGGADVSAWGSSADGVRRSPSLLASADGAGQTLRAGAGW